MSETEQNTLRIVIVLVAVFLVVCISLFVSCTRYQNYNATKLGIEKEKTRQIEIDREKSCIERDGMWDNNKCYPVGKKWQSIKQ